MMVDVVMNSFKFNKILYKLNIESLCLSSNLCFTSGFADFLFLFELFGYDMVTFLAITH